MRAGTARPVRVSAAEVSDARMIAEATEATGSAPWSAAQVRSELALASSRAYVAAREPGPEACGFLLARRAADELEVLQLHVSAAHRRSGIARALLDHAVRAEAGLARVWLEVRADNAGARAFYEAVGFGREATRTGYYADGTDAWVLSRHAS